MTEPRHSRDQEKGQRVRESLGLLALVAGLVGTVVVLAFAIGWLAVPLCGCLLLILGGWYVSTADESGTPAEAIRRNRNPEPELRPEPRVVRVDTEDPDPAAFLPEAPGTFTPPPPSRDESRDFERP